MSETLLPEAPDQKDKNYKTEGTEWSVLLEQQLPIDPDCCSLVFQRVVSQTRRHIPHFLKRISSIQKIFYVLCHDLRDILELVIETPKVVCSAGVLVCLFLFAR